MRQAYIFSVKGKKWVIEHRTPGGKVERTEYTSKSKALYHFLNYYSKGATYFEILIPEKK